MQALVSACDLLRLRLVPVAMICAARLIALNPSITLDRARMRAYCPALFRKVRRMA